MTFIAGKSGNEKGRPRGISDKRCRYQRLLEPHAEELIQILVDKAKQGDSTALNFALRDYFQNRKIVWSTLLFRKK